MPDLPKVHILFIFKFVYNNSLDTERLPHLNICNVNELLTLRTI